MSMRIFVVDNLQLGVHTAKLDAFLEALRKYSDELGVEIVPKMKQADIIVCNRYTFEIAVIGKPVVLLERFDAATIGHSRPDLPASNVIAVFKEFVLRPRSIYLNQPMYKGRYHYAEIIASQPNLATAHPLEQKQILPSLVEKLHPVPWNWMQYSHLDMVASMSRARSAYDPEKERAYDVMCVTNLHDKDDVLNAHRIQLRAVVDAFGNMTGRPVLTTPVNPKEFEDTLATARVCVSPFGIGERIATDQKAILAGCIVVKPRCAYVETFPDLYNEDCMVFFDLDADGASLHHTLEQVLLEPEVYVKRTQCARERLLSCTDRDYIAHFVSTVSSLR